MEERQQSSARRRILFCEGNTDETVGGSYFSLLYLVSGLNKSRYEPIVVFRKDNDLVAEYRMNGIDTRIIERPSPFSFSKPADTSSKIYRFFFPVLRRIQNAVNLIRMLILPGWRYSRLLKKNNVHLVHLNNSITRNHDWMLAAQIARTKCVTHERGINNEFSRISRYFAARLDAIVCISNAVRRCLQDNTVATPRSVTIYNGIDPSALRTTTSQAEVRELHDIGKDAKLIGVIGNIKWWKGQEVAVRALPRILESYPETVCLLIGDISPRAASYGRQLRQLISNLNLRDKVVFTGYTANVADYLATLDVVLHTSIDPEPFGRVLIEAMSMKKPLIGAAAGAVPEIVLDGETGLTFEPGDHDSLATCVLRVFDDPERAKNMCDQGYVRLQEKFHIDRNVNQTEKLYDELLSE